MKKIMFKLDSFFFFVPKTLYDLAFFRIGVGILSIAYFLQVGQDTLDIFGEFGVVRREIQELYIVQSFIPRLSWLCDAFKMLPNYDEKIVLNLLVIVSVLTSFCMLIGLFTRWSSLLTWFLFLFFYKSSFLSSYGFESFLCTSLFCCSIMPIGSYASLDNILKNKISIQQSVYYGFSLRVIQIHLCLVYFFGGFFKAMGLDWWTGESIWRALSRQPFNIYDFSWMTNYPLIPLILGVSTLIIETLYPVFTWFLKIRPYWVGMVLLIHLSIGIFMGLYLFAAIMIIFNITAFEWQYIEKYFKSINYFKYIEKPLRSRNSSRDRVYS